MLIRLLCAHEMTKHVCKNFAFKFQAVAEKKLQKLLGATLFCRTLYYNTTVRKRHAARCSPGPIYPVKEVMFSPALVSLLVNKITQKLFNIFPQNSAERWLVGYRRNHQILVLIRIT